MLCFKKRNKKHKKSFTERSFLIFRNILETFFNYKIESLSDLKPSFFDSNNVVYCIDNITSKLRSQNSLQFIEFFTQNKSRLIGNNIQLIEMSGPVISELTAKDEKDNLLLRISNNILPQSNNENQKKKESSELEQRIDIHIKDRKSSFILRDGVMLDLQNAKNLDNHETSIKFFQLRYTVRKQDLTEKILKDI